MMRMNLNKRLRSYKMSWKHNTLKKEFKEYLKEIKRR